MNKPPHKHAALIKAWADGASIQFYSPALGKWMDIQDRNPQWSYKDEYRIKPEPVKVKYRIFLQKSLAGYYYVATVCPSEYPYAETWSFFVKWLGPEQEIEVEG